MHLAATITTVPSISACSTAFSNDKILLCGQIAPFFTVEKVELGFFDNFANLTRDVRIGLSNGQFIVLLDVGDSGDWEADDVDPEISAELEGLSDEVDPEISAELEALPDPEEKSA